jgi:hypothetical protein
MSLDLLKKQLHEMQEKIKQLSSTEHLNQLNLTDTKEIKTQLEEKRSCDIHTMLTEKEYEAFLEAIKKYKATFYPGLKIYISLIMRSFIRHFCKEWQNLPMEDELYAEIDLRRARASRIKRGKYKKRGKVRHV